MASDDVKLKHTLVFLTVVSGVFVFVSMGTQWAKVEYKPENSLEKLSCSGDDKSYVMPYFGICEKVTINDKNADNRCTEWKDKNAWKSVDNANDALGIDSNFEKNAEEDWPAVQGLLPIAAILCVVSCGVLVISYFCSWKVSFGASVIVGIVNAAALGFLVAAVATAASTSAMQVDDYDAVFVVCSDKIFEYGPGFVLNIFAIIFLAISVAGAFLFRYTGCC